MTASLQNTLWNRHCLLEKSRTDFLIARDSARQDLIAVEEALSLQVEDDELVPDGADYAGNGCWRYRGFTIQAIEQENPLDGRRFKFVAVARAKNFLFDDLIQAAAWLDGVRHGMEYPADKPVMVRRPYQKEGHQNRCGARGSGSGVSRLRRSNELRLVLPVLTSFSKSWKE